MIILLLINHHRMLLNYTTIQCRMLGHNHHHPWTTIKWLTYFDHLRNLIHHGQLFNHPLNTIKDWMLFHTHIHHLSRVPRQFERRIANPEEKMKRTDEDKQNNQSIGLKPRICKWTTSAARSTLCYTLDNTRLHIYVYTYRVQLISVYSFCKITGKC